jgi:hypothetical protein
MLPRMLLKLESRVEPKRARSELNMSDIVIDAGLRNPIDEFHHDIRAFQMKTDSYLCGYIY